MAAGDTQITIVGNLVDDPQLRYTPTGQAVANFRVASTPRYLDKNSESPSFHSLVFRSNSRGVEATRKLATAWPVGV